MSVVQILGACEVTPKTSAGNPFAAARQYMAQALADDLGLREGYQANIAMLLHDRFNEADFTDHAVRNRAAREILQLVFFS